MNKINYIIFFCILIIGLLTSCSNTKFLSENEVLYTGIKNIEIIADKEVEGVKSIQSLVYWSAYYKPNNSFYLPRRILPPLGLWVHNYWEPDTSRKKFKNWVYKTFDEEPVLISNINLDLRTAKIKSELFNTGYFDSFITTELFYSRRNHKKAKVIYRVYLHSPYLLNSYQVLPFNPIIDTLLAVTPEKSKLIENKPYNYTALLQERKRLEHVLGNQGFYHFKEDLVSYNLDTTKQSRKINIYAEIAPVALPKNSRPYTINSIWVQLINDKLHPKPITDSLVINEIHYSWDELFITPSLISKGIYQKPGEKYTIDKHSKTANHLTNLGIFDQININYDTVKGKNELIMKILITQLNKIVLSAESNVVNKSNGFVGPAFKGEITNQNAFGGGEKWNLSLKCGFEWQSSDPVNTGLGINSYDFGLNSSISFPKIIAPTNFKKFTNTYIPQTNVGAGVEVLNRVEYYKAYSFNVSYGYKFRTSAKSQFTFNFPEINFFKLVDTTAAFSEIYQTSESIQHSFDNQFITSTRGRFAYDNSKRIDNNYGIYSETSVAFAGNLLKLSDNIFNTDEPNKNGEFLGTQYAQFFRFTQDLRYFYYPRPKTTLINRFYLGIGIPYGNSSILPYVEQFFSGGANSLRGFTPRIVGPGSFNGDTLDYYDQSGDIKLEYNIEYRFILGQKLFGATFIDAGNIWLYNEDPQRPGSQFYWNKFYTQIAVSTGVGLRYDIDFLVLRFDFGIPIYNPGYPKGENYIFNPSHTFKNKNQWFIAVGYPF